MSNIVKLKLKRKPRAAKVAAKTPADTRIIEACISYAQLMAGHKAAHRASPADDYADRISDQAFSRAAATLLVATGTAKTATALNAKARIVPVIIDYVHDGSFEPEHVKFLSSFAADVKAYLQPTVDDEWRARTFGEETSQ